jgi:hypothetical protein
MITDKAGESPSRHLFRESRTLAILLLIMLLGAVPRLWALQETGRCFVDQDTASYVPQHVG